MEDPLATEKAYWAEHRERLTEAHRGKFLLIKGRKVHGVLDTYDDCVDAGVRLFGRGPFWACSVEQPEREPLFVPALVAGVPLVANPQPARQH